MKNKALLIATAALLIFVSWQTASANDKWVDVGESDAASFSVKADSYAVTTNKANEEVASVIGKGFDKQTKQVVVEKWYVRTADCTLGYGKLVTLDIDGEYKYENSFADGDGSISSSIAAVICGVYKQFQADALQKSI